MKTDTNNRQCHKTQLSFSLWESPAGTSLEGEVESSGFNTVGAVDDSFSSGQLAVATEVTASSLFQEAVATFTPDCGRVASARTFLFSSLSVSVSLVEE